MPGSTFNILDVQTVILRVNLQKLLRELEELRVRFPISPEYQPFPTLSGSLMGQVDYAGNALLADLYKSHVMSGDPDGAPAKAIRETMQGLAEVYSKEAVRIQNELRELSRERVSK